MLKIKEVIIVEGNYDKIKLENIVDTMILPTNGFQIFNDKEKMALIRTLAKERGIVILTDSDRAGFLIRSHLKSCIPSDQIKQAYIPDIAGVEKRKKSPSKEGLLGVEGMKDDVIKRALLNAGCTASGHKADRQITKQDFFIDGLSGGPGSREKREALAKKTGLPRRIAANAMLSALNILYSYEEYKELVQTLK